MGRPRKHLLPEHYSKLKAGAANGLNYAQLSRLLEMDTKTLRSCIKSDPLAAVAYEDGKAEEEGALVGLMFKEALGGNVRAAEFLLRARHNYRDQGPIDTGNDGRPQITINLPAALPADAYQKLITVSPRALPSPGEVA